MAVPKAGVRYSWNGSAWVAPGRTQQAVVDPEPGRVWSRQTVAIIGDDRVVNASPAALTQALVGQGFLSSNVWLYAVAGKTTASADTSGRTVATNIADARDYFGGDPDAWVFVVASNSSSASVQTELSQPLLGVQNNYDRRLMWWSGAQAAFNTAAQPLVAGKKNAAWVTSSATGAALINEITQNVGPATAGADGGWSKAQLLNTPARAGASITDQATGRTWSTVRYEDLYVAGDTFQQTLNRVTGGKIITLPDGVYTVGDFTNGYRDSIRLGSGGATGCIGIAGSGRNTIIRLAANVATITDVGIMITIDRLGAGPAYFGNFQMQADDQSIAAWNALSSQNCPGSLVEWVYLNGATKGYANYPPGETFGIEFLHCDDAVVRDCEVDGRNRVTRARQGASPCGWNGAQGAYAQNAKVERSYFHHSLTSMLTFWLTNGVTLNNVHSWTDGSGSGQLAASQVNLEEVTGVVRFNYPKLYAYGSYYQQNGWPNDPYVTANNSFAFAQACTTGDLQNMVVTEPRFDVGVNGLFTSANYRSYTSSGGVTNKITTQPRIVKRGVNLTGHDHDTSGWQATATLDADFTWVR